MNQQQKPTKEMQLQALARANNLFDEIHIKASSSGAMAEVIDIVRQVMLVMQEELRVTQSQQAPPAAPAAPAAPETSEEE